MSEKKQVKEKKSYVQNLTGGEIYDDDEEVVFKAGETKEVTAEEAKRLKATYPNFVGDVSVTAEDVVGDISGTTMPEEKEPEDEKKPKEEGK